MDGIKTETLIVLGVALGVVYLTKVAADKVANTTVDLWNGAKDAAQAVNPFNDNNVINKAATSVYQAATGSTGTIGGDLYDATHGIETTVKPDSAVGIAGTSIFEAMTGGVYDN